MAGPWEDYQPPDKKAGEAKPWEAYGGGVPKKSSGSALWNTAADFFKSIPGGLAAGTRSSGAFGTQGALEEDPAQATREKAAGQLHQPQGFAGRLGGAVGEAATNPLTYTPMGSAAKTIGGVGGSILGGQIGSDVGGPVGGFVGGMAGGMGGARALGGKPPVTAPRTVETKPVEASNPTLDAATKTMRALGVEPPAGTLRQSPGVRNVEQLGGDKAALNAERQVTAKSADLMGTMGDNLSPKLLEDNMNRLKGDFERSTNQLSIVMDEKNTLLDELTEIRKDYSSYVNQEVQTKLDRLIRDASPFWENELGELETNTKHWADGTMPGKNYHSMVKTGSKMDEAIHGGQADLSPFARKIRQALDRALESSATSPEQQQALALFKKTKEEYFNQKVINKAIVRKAEEGKRIGLVDSEKLYNELKTYGWDGGSAKNPLEEMALAAVSTVPRSKPAGLFSAGHEAGSGRWAARGVGGAIGSAIGGGIGAVAGGVPGFAYGAGVGASLGSAAGPRIAGNIANSPRVQNFLKTNREITKAVRAKADATEAGPKIGRSLLRGTVGASSAQKKKKQRIYDG